MWNTWHYMVDVERFVREGFHDKSQCNNFLSFNSVTVIFFFPRERHRDIIFWNVIVLQQHFPLKVATVNFCLRLHTTLFSVTECCHLILFIYLFIFVLSPSKSKCGSLDAAKEVVSSRSSCHTRFLPMMKAWLLITSLATTDISCHCNCSLTLYL